MRIERWNFEPVKTWFEFVDGRFVASGWIHSAIFHQNLTFAPPDLFEAGLSWEETHRRLLLFEFTRFSVSGDMLGMPDIGEMDVYYIGDAVLGFHEDRLAIVEVLPTAQWEMR